MGLEGNCEGIGVDGLELADGVGGFELNGFFDCSGGDVTEGVELDEGAAGVACGAGLRLRELTKTCSADSSTSCLVSRCAAGRFTGGCREAPLDRGAPNISSGISFHEPVLAGVEALEISADRGGF